VSVVRVDLSMKLWLLCCLSRRTAPRSTMLARQTNLPANRLGIDVLLSALYEARCSEIIYSVHKNLFTLFPAPCSNDFCISYVVPAELVPYVSFARAAKYQCFLPPLLKKRRKWRALVSVEKSNRDEVVWLCWMICFKLIKTSCDFIIGREKHSRKRFGSLST